jgi:hypothetical protein
VSVSYEERMNLRFASARMLGRRSPAQEFE